MQFTALFTLRGSVGTETRRTEAHWRAAFVAAGIGTYPDWNQVRVVAVQQLLWLIAGSPAAGAWLNKHIDAIAGAVAGAEGGPVPLELRERAVGVRAGTDQLWAYRFPRLVVTKTSGDWGRQMTAPLPADEADRLAAMIQSGLRRELATWDRLPAKLADDNAPFLVVTDPGRAIPVAAIGSNRSGHGRPVSVLVRRHVHVMSYWRLEGDLSVGPLASLGYGRLLRASAPDLLSPALQRALTRIQPIAQEI